MRLTVCGATGGTGRLLVGAALDAGHEVAAVVRDPDRLPDGLRERAEVVVADALDAGAIKEAVQGRDAVISTIGTRDLRAPTSVCAGSARAIVEAMRAGGGGRLVIASNSGMAPGPGDDAFTRYVVKPIILARVLRHMIDDMRAAEEVVRASGLDWTIVRAGRLTDRAGRGSYRSRVDRNVPGGFQVSRAGFARAMLDAAGDAALAGHVVSVGN